jgi:outer membrane protein
MKTRVFKYLTLAVLALSLDATETYIVDDLIIKSLQNSPDLAVSQFEYNASKSRYDTALSGYLPTVDFTGSAGRISQSATFNLDGVQDNVIKGQLTLKQIIYDFGKTGGNSDTQKFASESYSMQNLQNISNKKLDVKNAYYTVLKAKALINVQKENVKLTQAQLYRSKKYFTAGIKTKIDVSDATVRLIQAKLDLKTAEYDLKLSFSNLDKVIGLTAIENNYDVYSQKLDLSSLFESLLPYELNLHDSIVFAYANRFDIKKEQALVSASQSDIRTIESEYYPSFYFGANYLYQNAQSEELQTFLPETQWNAMLNLDYNIYQGGSTSSRKEEKSINASISNSQLINTKLLIKANATDAYINVNRTRDTVELAQSLVTVSSQKFDQASKRYEYGLSDYIELQEARQGYINSKATLIVDYYNYFIAVATLDNAIGK